jgi:hypothetical protein
MRILPTITHGALDYVMGLLLFALPRVLGWNAPVTALMTVMAVVTVGYSLATRYEFGVFRVIPLKAHLTLDILSGIVFLCAAPVAPEVSSLVRWALSLIAIFEIGIALITSTETTIEQASPGLPAETIRRRQRGI